MDNDPPPLHETPCSPQIRDKLPLLPDVVFRRLLEKPHLVRALLNALLHQRLMDLLELHLLEIPKYEAAMAECSTDEEKWLRLLFRGHQMTLEEVIKLGIPEIVEAEQRLREISTDWDLRVEYELRDKAERDRLAFWEDERSAGREKGEKLGREKGEKLALRTALLQVLRSRGLSLPAQLFARIETCEDLVQLSAWFQRALTCQSAAELL